MTVEELYIALKELEQTTEAAERARLLQALIKRVIEYGTE